MPFLPRRLTATLFGLTALLFFAGSASAESTPHFEIQGERLQVQTDAGTLTVSLQSPAVALGTRPLSTAVAPAGIEGDLATTKGLEISYPRVPLDGSTTLELQLHVTWTPEESLLRKSARVRLSKADVLQEVVLDRIDVASEAFWTHGSGQRTFTILDGPQSQPVFLAGRFVGIEFPVASTRKEGSTLLLAHRPGVRLEPGVWYETRTAVYGLTPRGEEVPAFRQYVARHRPRPSGLHINYNSWWTSPVPYSEADIVRLMETLDAQLYQAHGVPLDSFCIDLGWSNPKSLWEIDTKQFPNGFTKIGQTAAQMQAKLGLWISPGSQYGQALDPQWAKEQGFETMKVSIGPDKNASIEILCLGGTKYAERFRNRLTEMVGRFGIGQLKFDGLSLVCPEADHGHEPGAGSSEAIAEGLIAAAQAARQANPDVWIEATCFGYNPSPWWLFHVNSVLGNHGDDAPSGRVPCPVYRESYTTARDFFNLQSAALSPLPAVAQEVLGIIHQSPEPFLNDAVMTLLRGHRFVPLYINPKYMDDARWRSLAELLRWARGSARLLDVPRPLLPASWQSGSIPQFTDEGTMPPEPYGYAHLEESFGLIVLRNPWIARQNYRVTLDRSLGLSPEADWLSAVSLYPERRTYASELKYGDVLDVPLAPYETVVLSVMSSAMVPSDPPVAAALKSRLTVLEEKHSLEQIAFRGEATARGPDWTCPLGDARQAARLTLDARVRVEAPNAELLLLCEGEQPQMLPVGSVLVNGQPVTATTATSVAGWSATALPMHGHWAFLRVPLAPGENGIALEQTLRDHCHSVSAWLWATKPGGAAAVGGALPQPEVISLDSAELLPRLDVTQLPAATTALDRPVERIDGIYLDALEPVSVTQGFGTLQKNRSVWEKPLLIAGQAYQRGLGTHAPSKIVYHLDAKYRRFQAWAGGDGNAAPTVSFEVWLDGTKRWESGPMTRETPAALVDLDVTGVQTMELIVDDLGNNSSDHADWADARLLY